MLTLIVKATEYCNANCMYCAVRDKEAKRTKMSMEVLRTLMERIAEYLAADPQREANITWHGGEPALMGRDFYRAVQLLQREVLGESSHRLVHSMQSNLTLVTDELADALELLGLKSVGTSFDWVPGLRGLGETVDSEAYARQFFRGVEVLIRRGIKAGAIFVVTSRTVAHPVESMVVLGNLLGKGLRGHFRINPLYMEGEASRDVARDLAITAEQYGHFLGKAYQYWYPRRTILQNVAPFSYLSRAADGDFTQMSCEETGACSGSHLAVGPAGELFQCGRAMDNDILRYGTLADGSFDQVFAHPLKRELGQRTPGLQTTDCRDCALWRYCHGGCPVDGYIYKHDWKQKTFYCQTKHILMSQYVLPMQAPAVARSKGAVEGKHANGNGQAIV